MDLMTLRKALEAEKYIFDEELLLTLYIALKLEKPLLVEGAAGVGKTEVAKVLAAVYGTELIRLQCYEGLDESKALYEWNYQKQLLSIQLGQACGISTAEEGIVDSDSTSANLKLTPGSAGLFGEEYLLMRPLLKAIRSDRPSVLLIDEIDKTDEEFEAFLLELLSDFQVSIPELGTIKAKNKPVVILTSNNTRQLSDALKRRCAYLFIEYPSIEKETDIILARLPNIRERLAKDVASAVSAIRSNEKIFKKPSIAETLDWVTALTAIGKNTLDADGIEKTLGFVLKNREDLQEFRKDGGIDGLIGQKHT